MSAPVLSEASVLSVDVHGCRHGVDQDDIRESVHYALVGVQEYWWVEIVEEEGQVTFK